MPAISRPVFALRLLVAVTSVMLYAASPARAASVEVLHRWTSGGEAKSLVELKRVLGAQGYKWRDVAVAGGGGDVAMSLLSDRMARSIPPTAAQIKGAAIQEWGKRNALATLDDIAREQAWDSQLPRVVADLMKYQGHCVAVPVNVHRVNWL